MQHPLCDGQESAEKAVNEVWESCFRDTRPFDEVSAPAGPQAGGVEVPIEAGVGLADDWVVGGWGARRRAWVVVGGLAEWFGWCLMYEARSVS